MNIGIDITPLTSTRTGVGNYTYYLLKHMCKLSGDHRFRGFHSGLSELDLGALEGLIEVRKLRLPTRAVYKLWEILKTPKIDQFLGGVDIYHATNYFLPPTRRARRVVTIHDLAFLAVPQLCSPKIVGPFARGIQQFAREADAIMAYSESTKRDIVNFLGVSPDKIHVAPMAVDDAFQPVDREQAIARVRGYGVEPPFILFVSTIEPRKNVAGLLRAFHRIGDEFPHKLVLIGAVGWNAEPIFDTLARLKLEDRVVRPGFVSHLELPAFYCAADAFLFPTAYEGFGLPLLEALTCGCPVVTSDNSSVPEVTGGAALYSNCADDEAVAANLRRVLTEPDLRADLTAKGRAQAGRFSWNACAETTLNVYKSLL